ncbi:DUF6491 family protein [Lysobacter sp. LF1]|uniref:DUF6491 family protein n=1 Tax=Lysobacter stagni TaxID=3045172 RepID=A0ABT6XKL6_9GAMM|nr:DUF6491 family protein [Lysobacter sp. LF1]MDI9240699.1 DUF6491 family protein [Lysobacter sp. LF1]
MKSFVFAVLATFVLGGCASDRLTDADRLALYRAHAGAPVPSFQYFGQLDGWTPLGNTALAVWTRPSQVYLLELQATCTDLDFANAISVTNQFGRVYSRFDKVLVLGSAVRHVPCWIREIRPIDVKALRAAEQEKRQAQMAERDKA